MILSHSCGFCYFIFYFLNFIPYRLRIIVEYSFTVREEKLPPRVALRVPMRRREAGPAPCPARSPLTALTAPGGAPAAAGARRRGLAGARGRCRSSLPRRRLPGRAERRGRGAAWRRRRGLRRGPGGGGSAWGKRPSSPPRLLRGSPPLAALLKGDGSSRYAERSLRWEKWYGEAIIFAFGNVVGAWDILYRHPE